METQCKECGETVDLKPGDEILSEKDGKLIGKMPENEGQIMYCRACLSKGWNDEPVELMAFANSGFSGEAGSHIYKTVSVKLTTFEENLEDLMNTVGHMAFCGAFPEQWVLDNFKRVIEDQYFQGIVNLKESTPHTEEKEG
jgi:hypothetical protein